MWQRASDNRPRPRRRGGRPVAVARVLRAALTLATCAALVVLLLRSAPFGQPSYRLRVRVRPLSLAPDAAAPAAPSGNTSFWEDDWDAEHGAPDALHDTAQGPGSAQWRAQQAGVEHLLAGMAAAGAALPAFDGAATARERAAFAPRSWAAAAGDPDANPQLGSAAGAAHCDLVKGLGTMVGPRQAQRAAAAERVRVLRLDMAAALHWAELDLPTLDQPDPAARRCAPGVVANVCVMMYASTIVLHQADPNARP